MVKHLTFNQGTVGSSPAWRIKICVEYSSVGRTLVCGTRSRGFEFHYSTLKDALQQFYKRRLIICSIIIIPDVWAGLSKKRLVFFKAHTAIYKGYSVKIFS